jgi:exosortase family protein XrtF
MSLISTIKKNKAVLKFLLVFFGTYIILALLYQAYIKYVTWENYYPDYVTHKVAEQSYHVIDFLGYETYINKNSKLPQMQLWIKDKPVVRIIEGCNGISVIILFLSFIVAFNKGFKKTLLFILFGSVLIYALNVIRIALLTLGLYFYHEYSDFLHDILFPLFIYGVVFLLWVYWVKNYKKSPSE